MKTNKPYPKGDIVRGNIPNPQLKFSFKFFDNSDSELCPPSFQQSYTQVLMSRLKEISCLSIENLRLLLAKASAFILTIGQQPLGQEASNTFH